MQVEVIKKRFPLLDEEGRPSSYPNFADQVFFPDGEPLSEKSFGISALDVYPVGSIYLSVSSTSPASLFGGTWERLKDRFLLGAGDTYKFGATGGEAKHTLTVGEAPSHRHYLKGHTYMWGSSGGNVNIANAVANGGETSGNRLYTYQGEWDYSDYTGGNQPHNNMPPYLAVYMWKRVA